MVSRRFNAGITVFALLLGFTSYAMAWSIYREYQLVTTASLFLVWVLWIILLILHVRRTNRELAGFFTALEFDDTSNLFDTESSRGCRRELFESFNRIILAFRELKIRKEQEQLLLQSTIEQTGAGILVMDTTGEVKICNRTFKDLLAVKSFSKLEELKASHSKAYEAIKSILPGHQEFLEFSHSDPKSFEPNNRRQLVLNAREFVVEERKMKVLTAQNIQKEIEHRESNAWEKLIRIFNHEILNSISPINLLSAGLLEMLQVNDKPVSPEKMDSETIRQFLVALKTIRKRGQGLVDFVESYRAIERIPEPVLQDLLVSEVLRDIIILMDPDLKKQGITCSSNVHPGDLMVRADESLLQQALINLVRNAIAALKGIKDPVIRLEAAIQENRPVISVSDNGPGIPQEILENIFTPFFTSSKEGSGIGLSLARQVMKMHHGTISAGSDPGSGTVFSLHF